MNRLSPVPEKTLPLVPVLKVNVPRTVTVSPMVSWASWSDRENSEPSIRSRVRSVPSTVTVWLTALPVLLTLRIAVPPRATPASEAATVPVSSPATPAADSTSTPRPSVSRAGDPVGVAVMPDSPSTVCGAPPEGVCRSTDTEPVKVPRAPMVTEAPETVTRTYGPAGSPRAAIDRVLTATEAVVAENCSGPADSGVTVAVKVPATPVESASRVAMPPLSPRVCPPTASDSATPVAASDRVPPLRVTVTPAAVSCWPAATRVCGSEVLADRPSGRPLTPLL